jgi:hypothetical protein
LGFSRGIDYLNTVPKDIFLPKKSKKNTAKKAKTEKVKEKFLNNKANTLYYGFVCV